MMPYTDHREIAYKLWVETGRDVKKVAELLRAGDPDEEWEPLPSAKPAMIRDWAMDQGWALRQYDDARDMAPDHFAQTRGTYHRYSPLAAKLIADVATGLLDNVDPRVVRNRLDAAKHITAVSGHLPVQLMNVTTQHQGPQKDHSREIADLTVDELRERRRLRALTAQSDSPSVTITPTLPDRTTEPDQSVIEADFGESRDTKPTSP